ncbi:MAG: hypothetical protein LC799_17325, partial [Actinobacteria bacterium]|nr:hypothetical protein [Actinomycetota bacterium]
PLTCACVPPSRLPAGWRCLAEDEALGLASIARQAEHDCGWLTRWRRPWDQYAEPKDEEPRHEALNCRRGSQLVRY